MACGFKPPRAQPIESQIDPVASYKTVREVLVAKEYKVTEEQEAERKVTVRSHVDEDDLANPTFITVEVTSQGKIVFVPKGALVHPDGKIHRSVNNELDDLREAIEAKLGAPPSLASASASPIASTAPSGSAQVAAAWNEPAYDPKIWGPGDFTCLPVKIPTEDQQTLKLRLSNGEDADLVLSLAYAPELCRSPAQCPLPTGCPALGFGDSQQVNKLAQRLVDKEIGDMATVVHRGQPVVTINLASHGLVSKAMTQLKPTKKDGAPAGAGW